MMAPRPVEAQEGGRALPTAVPCTLVRGPWCLAGVGVEIWLSGFVIQGKMSSFLLLWVFGSSQVLPLEIPL